MKYINQDFLQRELSLNGLGYLPFVEWSTSEIVRVNNLSNMCINSTEVFWLFSYIKNNYRSTLSQFCNWYDIENDVLGFPTVQRELRHSIEAYLDLYNLVNYEDYKQVLLYCCNSNKEKRHDIKLGEYKEFLFNNEFTIQSKYNISRLNNKELLVLAKEANSYTHPNVYLDIIKINSNKNELLRKLITTNLYVTNDSYRLFIEGLRTMGADTRLLNGYVNVNGYKYLYQEWYDIKKNEVDKVIEEFFYQPTHIFQNYFYQA